MLRVPIYSMDSIKTNVLYILIPSASLSVCISHIFFSIPLGNTWGRLSFCSKLWIFFVRWTWYGQKSVSRYELWTCVSKCNTCTRCSCYMPVDTDPQLLVSCKYSFMDIYIQSFSGWNNYICDITFTFIATVILWCHNMESMCKCKA